MSRVLVLNCGSSSVKYRLFEVPPAAESAARHSGPRPVDPGPRSADPGPRSADPGPRSADPGPRSADPGPRSADPGPRSADPGPRTADPDAGPAAADGGTAGAVVVASGTVERIGERAPGAPRDHAEALAAAMSGISVDGLTAVGHRVVHGGLTFSAPALVDDAVLGAIADLVPLAPLHNPANLAGIEVARALLPGVPQVAVFDTAFHRTLSLAASTYAIDAGTAERYGIHRYGFHGTSHAIVSRRTAALLGRPVDEVNTITLHLGNGASACAVEGGRSVATSMGLSPLEGLVMGTRSGDLDPAIIFHLHRVAGMPLAEIDELLNRRSGLAGLAGVNDMRTLLEKRAAGDAGAVLAFDVYCRRIRSYVGAYYAELGRLDAITFTAGVGENAPAVRAAALAGLDRLGIAVDPARNDTPGRGARVISPLDAPVAVCVVPTDEEWEIASQTLGVVG